MGPSARSDYKKGGGGARQWTAGGPHCVLGVTVCAEVAWQCAHSLTPWTSHTHWVWANVEYPTWHWGLSGASHASPLVDSENEGIVPNWEPRAAALWLRNHECHHLLGQAGTREDLGLTRQTHLALGKSWCPENPSAPSSRAQQGPGVAQLRTGVNK